MRQPTIRGLRRFFAGGAYGGGAEPGGLCTGGITGGGAAIVGASNCFPQLRQKLSPGAAGTPHCEQTMAFNVGSLMS
jgi:hypothetical protein